MKSLSLFYEVLNTWKFHIIFPPFECTFSYSGFQRSEIWGGRMTLLTRRHLAMPGYIFGYHNQGEGWHWIINA